MASLFDKIKKDLKKGTKEGIAVVKRGPVSYPGKWVNSRQKVKDSIRCLI